MERKIGEKFTIDGKTYITEECSDCEGCAFYALSEKCYVINAKGEDLLGFCDSFHRSDEKSVIFKELKETK